MVKVNALEHILNRLSTHQSDELVGILIRKQFVVGVKIVDDVVILLFRKQLTIHDVLLSIFSSTCLDNDVALIVDDSIKLLGGKTEKITNLVGQRTEVPDVSNWHNECDVTSTFTTHLLLCHLNTTTVADDTFVADALVLAAMALIVLRRTEDTLAE